MNSIYPLNDKDPDDESGVQVTLGLQREPFSAEPAKEYFYAEQTRSQRLKLLHHLAPYGELLIVTGETGSGKTTLLQQFVERAHETWRLCVIAVQQKLDQGQLLDALVEGFALQAPQAGGDADKLQLLKSHCVALKRKGLLPMVVIDDAHLLTGAALGALLQLLQSLDAHEKPLRIILFAGPQLREAVSVPELGGLQERISHTFNLPPFSEKETGNYIRHRLKVAGGGGEELFTDAVVAMIHKTSQGQPAKVNELAKVVLTNKSGGGAALRGVPGDKGGRDPKGGRNVIPLGVALAVVILAGLYWLQNANTPPAGGVKEQVPIARSGGEETLPLSLPSDTAPADGGAGATARQAPGPFADQGPAATASSAGGNEPPGHAGEQQTPAGGTPDMNAAPAPSARATEPPASPSAGAATPPETVAAAPPLSAVGGPAEPAPPKPTAAHAKAPAGPPQGGGGIKGAKWVLAQDPKHFTMQLTASHTPVGIGRFVQHSGLKAGDFAEFQKISGGKRWHVLIYGAYASRGQAEDRAKHLPGALHGVKPWIRPFGDIQASIRQYRRAHP